MIKIWSMDNFYIKKTKILTVTTILILSFLSTSSAWSESTTLDFSGNIRQKPCTFKLSSQHQVMNLGRWQSRSDFPRIGSVSKPVSGELFFGCYSAKLRTITYEATSVSSEGSEYIKITNEGAEGNASGIAVKFYDKYQKKEVKLNTPINSHFTPYFSSSKENQYVVYIEAQYIRIGNVTPGLANAVLSISLTHE